MKTLKQAHYSLHNAAYEICYSCNTIGNEARESFEYDILRAAINQEIMLYIDPLKEGIHQRLDGRLERVSDLVPIPASIVLELAPMKYRGSVRLEGYKVKESYSWDDARISQADLLILKADLESIIAKHMPFAGDSSIKPDATHKFNPNERNTMLKLILGMAIDAYDYDPRATKNTATGDNKYGISNKLATRGVNISNDTIQKYLDEAKKKFPSEGQ